MQSHRYARVPANFDELRAHSCPGRCAMRHARRSRSVEALEALCPLEGVSDMSLTSRGSGTAGTHVCTVRMAYLDYCESSAEAGKGYVHAKDSFTPRDFHQRLSSLTHNRQTVALSNVTRNGRSAPEHASLLQSSDTLALPPYVSFGRHARYHRRWLRRSMSVSQSSAVGLSHLFSTRRNMFPLHRRSATSSSRSLASNTLCSF